MMWWRRCGSRLRATAAGPRLLIRQQVELAFLDIANARSEAKAEEVAEAKHVICHTTGVGVVLLNRQSRIVIEKPIEDVRRLARGRRDHLGIEWPELVGDVGIERDAGLVAMACIHVRDCSTCPASTEVLPVRR